MNEQGGALTSWGTSHPVLRHPLLLECLISGAGSTNPTAEIFHLLELIIGSSDYFSLKRKPGLQPCKLQHQESGKSYKGIQA